MKAKLNAFTLMEALITLAMVGIVLQLVVQGYQELFRISHASQSSHKKLEQQRAFQQIVAEVSSAVEIVRLQDHELSFKKLSAAAEEINGSVTPCYLPSPLPVPAPAPPPESTPYYPPYQGSQLNQVSFTLRNESDGKSSLLRTSTMPPNSQVLVSGIEQLKWSYQGNQPNVVVLELNGSGGNQKMLTFLPLIVVSP